MQIFKKIFPLLFILSIFSCSSLPELLPKEADLVIEEHADYILLTSSTSNNTKSGIVFYPGGLVDPHSYIEPLKALVLQDNRTLVILKVSSNLAILDSKKASAIIKKIKNVKSWVVGGHSLGGSVACIDAFKNPDSFDAMFLLAAYSINDLSASDMPVLSITASNDKVLQMDKFEENRKNLPQKVTVTSPNELLGNTSGKTIYYEIEGGNHAQFGSYGNQSGDGVATIDANAQQLKVIEMIRKFLLVNNL